MVEEGGKFYEVWGLTCRCGYVEPDGFVGASPTVGPATGWTHEKVSDMLMNVDKSKFGNQYIIDVRSDEFKQKE